MQCYQGRQITLLAIMCGKKSSSQGFLFLITISRFLFLKDILGEISQGIKSSQGKFNDFEFTIADFFKKEKDDKEKHVLNVVYPNFCVFAYNHVLWSLS
jgi:hypothetical protein